MCLGSCELQLEPHVSGADHIHCHSSYGVQWQCHSAASIIKFNITDGSHPKIKSLWGTHLCFPIPLHYLPTAPSSLNKTSCRQDQSKLVFLKCTAETLSPSMVCGAFHWAGPAALVEPVLLTKLGSLCEV